MVRFIDFKTLVIFWIMWSASFLDIYLKFDTNSDLSYEDLSSRIYDKRASHGTLELANCIQIIFTTSHLLSTNLLTRRVSYKKQERTT